MPPRKRAISRTDAISAEDAIIKPSTEVATHARPSKRKWKLPSSIRFALAVLVSMSLNVLLYGLATDHIRDLTVISRLDADWTTALVLFGGRIAELAVAWVAGFDGYDVAALALLTHAPYYYLLLKFYTISETTVALCMAIDLLATSVPFYFLRGASAHHKANAPKGSIANRSVIEDLPIQIVTSVLGAGIYSSVVLAGYVTFLPTLLILHFENLPSLVAAYDTQFFVLILSFLPVGIATKVFLFTPTAAARRDVTDAVNAQFDAETATLAETIWYNVWGYSKRVRVLILRTLIMAGMSGVSTITRSFASIEGVELVGAIGWTLPWVVSALFTGAAYGWVTGTEVLA